ncbi:MAG: EF-P lysine aminoacylase GenX [Alphaproteobacteria bacterium]|nr:EF-P lysine aminoacylase GenX [Alphaproteobacteria bacterium]
MDLDVPAGGVLRARAAIVRALRDHLHAQGFVEIEAPVRVQSPALEEHLEAVPAGEAWLHTSPEFALKRTLAVSGIARLFSLGPCFRAEEWGPLHGTEFTMLEWYHAGTDYRGVAEDLAGLLDAACAAVGQPSPTLRSMSVAEAYARHGQGPTPEDPTERARMWVNDVEPRLLEPTLIWDYPANEAAFSVVRGDIAERFELYWRGVELVNAFTELLDPAELEARWEASDAARRAEGRVPHPRDPRLIEAVGRHPRAGGAAMGVDRLVMLLTGCADIRDVRVGG